MNNKTKRTNKGKSKTTRRKRRNFKGGDATVQAIIWRQRADDTNANEYDYALLVNDTPKSVQDAFRRSTDSAEYFLNRSFEMKGPIPNGVNPYVKKLEIKFGERSDDEKKESGDAKAKEDLDDATAKKEEEEDEKAKTTTPAKKKTKDNVNATKLANAKKEEAAASAAVEDAKKQSGGGGTNSEMDLAVKRLESAKQMVYKLQLEKKGVAPGSEDGDEEDEDEESYEEDEEEEGRVSKLNNINKIIAKLGEKNESERKKTVELDTYNMIMQTIIPIKNDKDYSKKYIEFTKSNNNKNKITERKQLSTIIGILNKHKQLLEEDDDD